MLIRITSAKCEGISSLPIIVEISVSSGIGLHLVGLADAAVKESLLRTTTALQSLGLKVPGKKIVINLAPADLHKKGSGYDLPIALGILAASEQLSMPGLGKYVIVGELGLDGTIRHIPGALPIVEMAGELGFEGCILPLESAMETAELCRLSTDTVKVFGVRDLMDVLEIVCERDGYESRLIDRMKDVWLDEHRNNTTHDNACDSHSSMDFCEIAGQESAKRGLEIAAAGGHAAILIGSPGSGKSSLAKAMCRILPPMTLDEAVQTSKIYSVAGRGNLSEGLMRQRPFRAPHTSASSASLIGGGSDPITPGEVSLANNGVLFLDEFLEIPRKTIEALRSPMEDKKIVISRLKTKVEYPANFTLIAAANPCPCGYYGESDRCTCSVGARNAYLAKLSGPIMDRIDIQIWCKSVSAKDLLHKREAETSATVAERVAMVREIQRQRFAGDGIFCNAQMDNRLMEKYCPLSTECRDFLEKAMDRMGLSARAATRIIKLARTIADMDYVAKNADVIPITVGQAMPDMTGQAMPIMVDHLAEALSFRFLDKKA